MHKPKKILFGVLNWGLGHAARSIPIIKKLVAEGHEVVLASDGKALQLLRAEFPDLISYHLPSYNIQYSKKAICMPFKLTGQLPNVLKTVHKERNWVKSWVDKHQPDLIISDNRFGFRDSRVTSIYITHQLRVLSGVFSFFTTWLHRLIYKKYDQIWVPDFAGETNLSGKLGHLSNPNSKIKYIGVLTRMQPQKLSVKYAITALLSGPEPQRSLLEQKILKQLSNFSSKTALVQGVVSDSETHKTIDNTDIFNFLTAEKLQELINRSEVIISRSGYTSVMDLTAMHKKVIWIPTPGQFEQIYLARYLNDKYGFFYQNQSNFSIDLNSLDNLSPTVIVFDPKKTDDVADLVNVNFGLNTVKK